MSRKICVRSLGRIAWKHSQLQRAPKQTRIRPFRSTWYHRQLDAVFSPGLNDLRSKGCILGACETRKQSNAKKRAAPARKEPCFNQGKLATLLWLLWQQTKSIAGGPPNLNQMSFDGGSELLAHLCTHSAFWLPFWTQIYCRPWSR